MLNPPLRFTTVAAIVLLFAACSGICRAEQMGLRFTRVDAAGRMRLVPAGPDGALGWRAAWSGGVRQVATQQPRPTNTVSYRHPYSNCCVQVPVQLPDGTPKIEYVRDKYIYNYGTYTVTIWFLPDGNVETIYNSGLFRPLHLAGR